MMLIDITVSIVLLFFLFHICECTQHDVAFRNAFAVLDAIKPAFPSITLEEIKQVGLSSKAQAVLKYMVEPVSSSPLTSDSHLNVLREAIREEYTSNNPYRAPDLQDFLYYMNLGLKEFFKVNPQNHERQHFITDVDLYNGEDTQNDAEEQDLTARIQGHLERTLADGCACDLISVYMIRPVRSKIHKLPAIFSVPFGAVDEKQLVIRYHLMRDVKVPAVQDRTDEYFLECMSARFALVETSTRLTVSLGISPVQRAEKGIYSR